MGLLVFQSRTAMWIEMLGSKTAPSKVAAFALVAT